MPDRLLAYRLFPIRSTAARPRAGVVRRAPPRTGLRELAWIAAIALLAGCATADRTGARSAETASEADAASAPKPDQEAASAKTASASRSGGQAQAGPKAFAEVVKDAKEIPGFLTLHQKDEKVWIELRPEQFDRPFFLAINLSRGLGEKRLNAGAMGSRYTVGEEYVAEFRKIGTRVQLLAKNTRFTAKPGSPEARAVAKNFSDSLLASAEVVSKPHPDRKSVLVEANALLLTDLPAGAHAIERAYRNSFTFDAKNSFIEQVRSQSEQTSIDVTAHYAQPRIPLPPRGPSPAPFSPPPSVIEDPRSLFLGFLYSFTPLPEQPMQPRLADSRIGHFYVRQVDFSDERKPSPNRFLVQRWRLEKKDPAAQRSEPVKPIVFWLDREIPERYRQPIREGILEWNAAFERIGFKNAIEVRVQPDDADWDTADTLHASVRWMATATASYGAIGPSHVDPRTGEILDADIGIDANMTRRIRFFRTEAVGETHRPMYDEETGAILAESPGMAAGDARQCGYARHAAYEAAFAMALLEAREELDPEGPEAEQFVFDYLKDITMHEVGHTLGLMHNFRASTVYSAAQLADPEFTAKNGISGSVMEYNALNLARRDEPQGAYQMKTLGPYDHWAIEYAYRLLPPEVEGEWLQALAARSSDPLLAFANDVDAAEGLDPDVNQLDLGRDALAYYRKRIALSQELWDRLEKRELRPGESYDMLRRRFVTGFANISMVTALAAKYVGGVSIVRDHAGTGRAPMTPIPPTRQREALALLADSLLKVESFRVPPEFLRRLAPDRLERGWDNQAPTDLPLPDMILAAQKDVLNRLMSARVAGQLLNNATKLSSPGEALPLSELYDTLQSAIWEEAVQGTDAEVMRRNLQREHLRRVAGALLGSTPDLPADARALHRLNALQLRATLAAAVRSPAISKETRAHYAETLETLDQALRAPLVRSGV